MTQTSSPPIGCRDATSASTSRDPTDRRREPGRRQPGRRQPEERWDDADEIAAGLRQPVPLFGFDIEPTG
ncbi:MAG: hypothetical protein AAGE94_02585 [Acidobacteriota bacterium]